MLFDRRRADEIAEMLPTVPRGLGVPIRDRRAWRSLSDNAGVASIIRRARDEQGRLTPHIGDDDYLAFSRTGKSADYVRQIYKRKARLTDFVVAGCVLDDNTFIAAAEKEIHAICQERTWVQPASDLDLGCFHGRRMNVELVSSVTALLLATADWLLQERLSPDTRALLRKEVWRRALEPTLAVATKGGRLPDDFWWIDATNNWNAVCLDGTVGAALALVDDRGVRARFAAFAERNISNYLAGFTDDGYCDEGVGYWNYGFSNYLALAESLFLSSGGAINLYREPKVAEIAQYGRRIQILPGLCPAFADCPTSILPWEWLSVLPELRRGEQPMDQGRMGELGAQGMPDTELHIFALSFFIPSRERVARAVEPRSFFKDAEVLICRHAPPQGRPFGAAIKARHNGECHNHNDIGSYVVACGDSTPLVDPGNEVYTKRTFSPERYESDVINSFGHPIPVVAGRLQHVGREHKAVLLRAEFSDELDLFILDMRGAYDVPELISLERMFAFSRIGSGSLRITDKVRFARPSSFESALISYMPLGDLRAGRLVVGTGDSSVSLAISSAPCGFSFNLARIEEEMPGGGVPLRAGIALVEPVLEAEIEVLVTPAYGDDLWFRRQEKG